MTRLEKLQKKLRARQGVPGFEKNCELIAAEIARLTTVEDVAAPAGTSLSDQEHEPVASTASKD